MAPLPGESISIPMQVSERHPRVSRAVHKSRHLEQRFFALNFGTLERLVTARSGCEEPQGRAAFAGMKLN